MEVFEYYANNQWDFDNSSILHLRKLLNKTEKIKYKIDAEGMHTFIIYSQINLSKLYLFLYRS